MITRSHDLNRYVAAWERFWFAEVPPDIYAVLRVLFGALGLIGLFGLLPVSTFWTPSGLVPLPDTGFGALLYSLGLGSAAGWALYGALVVTFLCLTLGLMCRWAVPAAFVGCVLQFSWNRLPLSGVHDVLLSILFCLLWVDTGTTWSVDAWLARRRGESATTIASLGTSVWPLRLIRIQVALLYLSTGLWKLLGSAWRDGSALHYVLDKNTYQRLSFTLPASLDWLATVATYFTLTWEIGFAFLLLSRWGRRFAIGTGVLMHLGMFAAVEVGLFSWMMIASYVAFLEPSTVTRFMSNWERRASAQSPSPPPRGAEIRDRVV